MYQHISDPLSFRLNTWPWGGSSYLRVFNWRSHNVIFKPVLDYLKQELDKSPTLKVRYTTFTLVNVYSGFTDLSYGPLEAPHPKVRRGPLTFTFAMSRREINGALPRHIIWNTGHTALWGPSLQYGHDYLTISVPIDICSRCRMNNTLRPQMEWLYKIVGGWSKSIAIDRDSLTKRTTNVKLVRDQVYYKTIPAMMWRYPWNDWVYAREFWDRAPDILNVEVTDFFAEYFLTYLTRYYRKIGNQNINQSVIKAFDDIEAYVRRGVIGFVQGMVIAESTTLLSVISEDLVKQLGSGESLDIEAIVQSICKGNSP
jgi:hypothetical protein